MTTLIPLLHRMAWEMFQGFEQHARVDSGGYAGVSNVDVADPPKGIRDEFA